MDYYGFVCMTTRKIPECAHMEVPYRSELGMILTTCTDRGLAPFTKDTGRWLRTNFFSL